MSKIISQYLHFDSIAANYITDTNNTSGNTSNCFKAVFPMTVSFRKIKKVWLKSVEMVVGFPNIRTGSTNTFSYTLNGTSYVTTLSEANYTTVASFITAISTACTTTIGGTGITMTFVLTSSNTNRIQITFSGSAVTTFTITNTNLSKYILGFRTTDTYATNVFTGSCNYNLSADNYINIYIPSFNSLNANQNGAYSTFKLPLNTITNQVYFYQEASSFSQSMDIEDDNLVLSSLTVHILDRFGKNLNPNGLDYSFTLAVDYVL